MKDFLWFHEWDKWEEVEAGNIIRYGKDSGRYIVLKRICCNCGEVQIKEKKFITV